MSTALVVRTQRHKKIGDSNSPMVHTLKRKPQDAKIFEGKDGGWGRKEEEGGG